MRRTSLERVVSANPYPDPEALDDSRGESTLARIVASPRDSLHRSSRRRRISLLVPALTAALLVVVVVPAAVGKHFGLFGFANEGTPVDRGQLSMSDLTAVEQSGFGSDIRKLGERAGVAFYVARSKTGGLCFATGSASGAAPKLGHFVGCQRSIENAFPSPDKPILNLSPIKMVNPREAAYVLRLVGFAADGVAQVGFVATDGSLQTTPVVDNVFATDWFDPPVAATRMVALDGDGNTVFEQSLLLGR